MTQVCFICNIEIRNTSLIFKKSDLTINDLVVPNQMVDGDVLCVNCFDQRLKSPKTNTSKARIDKLVNILEKEMDKNNANVDSILEKLDTTMDGWSLSEPVKTAYLVKVMDIIEVAIQDESTKFSTMYQIRKMLSLNFGVPSQTGIKD